MCLDGPISSEMESTRNDNKDDLGVSIESGILSMCSGAFQTLGLLEEKFSWQSIS